MLSLSTKLIRLFCVADYRAEDAERRLRRTPVVRDRCVTTHPGLPVKMQEGLYRSSDTAGSQIQEEDVGVRGSFCRPC